MVVEVEARDGFRAIDDHSDDQECRDDCYFGDVVYERFYEQNG